MTGPLQHLKKVTRATETYQALTILLGMSNFAQNPFREIKETTNPHRF